MGYSDHPIPQNYYNVIPAPDKSALTSDGATRDSDVNPWTLMIQSALRAPDSHTVKSLRALSYGAIRYGIKGPGEIPGAFDSEGNEVLPGLKSVDGTVFIRAAGLLIDTLGWVDWGQPEGKWDRSALGWEDAWNDDYNPEM